jgi:acyl carrier protein
MEIQNIELTQINTVSRNNNANAQKDANQESPTTAEIQAWLVSYFADLVEIEQDEVDVTVPFKRFGLDSSAAIILIGDLENWLECQIDPTLTYDYPTIKALAQHLAEEYS